MRSRCCRWRRRRACPLRGEAENGSTVRNVEYLRFAGDRLSAVEVYFGSGPARRRRTRPPGKRHERERRHDPDSVLPPVRGLLSEGADRALRERHAVHARRDRPRRSRPSRPARRLVAAHFVSGAGRRLKRDGAARIDDHHRISLGAPSRPVRRHPGRSGSGPRGAALGARLRFLRHAADADDRVNRIRPADAKDPFGDTKRDLDMAYRMLDQRMASRTCGGRASASPTAPPRRPSSTPNGSIPSAPTGPRSALLRPARGRPSFARVIEEARPFRHFFPTGRAHPACQTGFGGRQQGRCVWDISGRSQDDDIIEACAMERRITPRR